jgi:hypothetical protein
MWSSFGLAAVATVVATTTGIVVLNRTAQLRAWCQVAGHVCRDGQPNDTAQRNLQADAQRLAVATDVAFLVAGVGALGGVVLLLVDRPTAPRGANVKVEAQLGRLVVSGQF